ncbi:MAG: hypothetical protein M1120_03225 [Patescibacteria group bacterium]|nr:hypothetical protein [Patescibacteria group bacterium]
MLNNKGMAESVRHNKPPVLSQRCAFFRITKSFLIFLWYKTSKMQIRSKLCGEKRQVSIALDK